MNDLNGSKEDEIFSILEETQDQLEQLQNEYDQLKAEDLKTQEEISRLSSENSILRNKLQQKSETIVSLNEKIGTLQESDKVLDENLNLRKKNAKLQEATRKLQKECEAEVAAAKNNATEAIAALSIRERNVSFREDRICNRERNLDAEVDSLAEAKIRGREKKMNAYYSASVKAVSSKYNRMTAGYRGILVLSVLYGLISTLIMAARNDTLIHDAIEMVEWIVSGVTTLLERIIDVGRIASGIGDQIPQPVVALIAHWFLMITVVSLLAGGSIVLIAVALIKYILFFKEHQADEISAFTGLFTLAVGVFAGDRIRSVLPVNLIVMMIPLFIIYSIVRGLIQMDNETVRSRMLKYGGVVTICIAGVVLMTHLFGIWGIVAIPIGMILVSGNR